MHYLRFRMNEVLTSHGFRVFTRLFVLGGIVASLSLMFHTGRTNESILLMSLFTAWVVSPFMTLLAASMVSANWPGKVQIILNLFMLAITAVAVLAYTGRVNPPGTRPAFMFLAIPLISWLAIMIIYFRARSRKQP